MSRKSENNKTHEFKNKRAKGGLILFIAIVAVLVGILLTYRYRGNHLYILKVNNEPVSKREFNQVMIKNRARIYTYFNNKYGAEDNEDFWKSRYGDEIPIEKAKKDAMDECIRTKTEQIIAKRKGLIEDISYSAFLTELNSENAARKNIVKNNGIIYGLVQYSEDNYFSYIHSNMVIRLKEMLQENELAVKEGELENYYETIKGEKFAKEDYVKIQKIYLSFDVETAGKIISDKQEKKNRIEQAKVRIHNGEDFEVVAKAFNEEGTILEQTFDDSTVRTDSRLNAELKAQAAKLTLGEISEIFEDRNAFYIIKCVDRKPMGYKLFEEVKDIVKIEYINKKYEEFIDDHVKKANIEINKNIYENIMIE